MGTAGFQPFFFVCPNLTAAEGRILGTGANMFKIAGPVLVYGILATVNYGVIYYIVNI